MSQDTAPASDATFSAGDVLVAKSEDGSFQVSRVSANGHSSHVMGCQQTEPAALLMASRATSGYQRVFRATFKDTDTGHSMADFAASRGYRRVAIYYVRSDYGRALANAFEERAVSRGLNIVARASYDPGQQAGSQNFEPTLRDWLQLEFDAVFLAGEVPQAGALIAQMRQAGITAQRVGMLADSTNRLVNEQGKPAAEDLRKAIAAVQHSAENLDAMVADARPGVQNFSKNTLPEVNHLVRDLRELSTSLKGFSERLEGEGVGGALGPEKLPDYKPGKNQ
jgi:hypothetical protein